MHSSVCVCNLKNDYTEPGNTRLIFSRNQHWSIQGWACHNINRTSDENK